MVDFDLAAYKRIVIMGGTFDPIHYGHLVAAEAVRFEFSAERVVFIPTGVPAHKPAPGVSPSELRYEMTVLATADNPFFIVSRMEIDRSGESYTIDTIKALRLACPDTELFFVIGADAIPHVPSWYAASELLPLCDFVAVTRSGYHKHKLREEVEHIKKRFSARFHLLEIPSPEISSTEIRERISLGKPVTYLLPGQVRLYIDQNRLYRMSSIDVVKSAVQNTLSERRYRHTLGVFEEALRLARIYGESEEKAGIAALLHDYAKEIKNSEKLTLCEQLNVKLDSVMRKNPELTHSFLSAALAREEFCVYDRHILNAIAYHTTGRKKMTTLEKIIFVADLTEPGRDAYDGVDLIREFAEVSLERAVIAGLNMKLDYTGRKNSSVHELSVEALEYYSKKYKSKGECL